MAFCDAPRKRRVDVSLTFENLILSVTPRSPTFIDSIAESYFHRGSLLGDIFKGPLEPPTTRVLDCPPQEQSSKSRYRMQSEWRARAITALNGRPRR